jgi:hypothetical protein
LFTALVFATALAATGCSRNSVSRSSLASQPANVTSQVTDQSAPDKADEKEGPHGSRKQKDVDVPVYVDGKPIATLRYGELPASLEGRVLSDHPTAGARYYRIRDYLAANGVDPARVRTIHLRGNGNRISSLDGDELARDPARFVFDFMEKDTGIARLRWDTTGLRNTFRIEEIRGLFVYVDKPVPALAGSRSCYVVDGDCSETVPYADGEFGKGTRVYLDGKLVGQVKRRRLTDDLIVGRDDEKRDRFDLAKFLQSVGVDVVHAARVELVAGDALVGRGAGSDLLRPDRRATFVLPAHQHGRVLLSIPNSWTGEEDATVSRETQVTAVLIYRSAVPTKRSLTRLSDVPLYPREGAPFEAKVSEPAPAEDG